MKARSCFIVMALICFPSLSYARSAMDRCFESYATNESQLFKCMTEEYNKRENTRKMIEEEILKMVHRNKSKAYHPSWKKRDIEYLTEGRQMFEEYRKKECNRQKVFLARQTSEGTYAHMVCLYDMTTQRIRALQNSIK